MTERKPPDMPFESWVDKQIREAQERGAFDDLPGAGKPIPDLDRPRDDTWWIKQKLRRENMSYLPPVLMLRKEIEDVRRDALEAHTERDVREMVAAINERIVEAIRTPLAGPPLARRPLDVEEIVDQWRGRHR